MCRLSWFLDPGGWGKATTVGLYFIFPGICTLSLLLNSSAWKVHGLGQQCHSVFDICNWASVIYCKIVQFESDTFDSRDFPFRNIGQAEGIRALGTSHRGEKTMEEFVKDSGGTCSVSVVVELRTESCDVQLAQTKGDSF
ncbi:hypothetical protein STEG23_038428 [Scotinomys teguina]